MSSPNSDPMDQAASDAAADLDLLEGKDPQAVQAVALWWAKWYLKAGHKRLGRELVKRSK